MTRNIGGAKKVLYTMMIMTQMIQRMITVSMMITVDVDDDNADDY